MDCFVVYLSVVCLKDVLFILDEKKWYYFFKCCERWEWYFDFEIEEDIKDSFVMCMDFFVYEVKVVFCEYFMIFMMVLCFVVVVFYLVVWDLMYLKVCFDKRVVRNNFVRNFRWNIDSFVRVVWFLLFGFVVVDNWMVCVYKIMDLRVKEFVEMYLEFVIVCCVNVFVRLDLIVMNVLLVLMGYILDLLIIDVLLGYLFCNLDDILIDFRVFFMFDVV